MEPDLRIVSAGLLIVWALHSRVLAPIPGCSCDGHFGLELTDWSNLERPEQSPLGDISGPPFNSGAEPAALSGCWFVASHPSGKSSLSIQSSTHSQARAATPLAQWATQSDGFYELSQPSGVSLQSIRKRSSSVGSVLAQRDPSSAGLFEPSHRSKMYKQSVGQELEPAASLSAQLDTPSDYLHGPPDLNGMLIRSSKSQPGAPPSSPVQLAALPGGLYDYLHPSITYTPAIIEPETLVSLAPLAALPGGDYGTSRPGGTSIQCNRPPSGLGAPSLIQPFLGKTHVDESLGRQHGQSWQWKGDLNELKKTDHTQAASSPECEPFYQEVHSGAFGKEGNKIQPESSKLQKSWGARPSTGVKTWNVHYGIGEKINAFLLDDRPESRKSSQTETDTAYKPAGYGPTELELGNVKSESYVWVGAIPLPSQFLHYNDITALLHLQSNLHKKSSTIETDMRQQRLILHLEQMVRRLNSRFLDTLEHNELMKTREQEQDSLRSWLHMRIKIALEVALRTDTTSSHPNQIDAPTSPDLNKLIIVYFGNSTFQEDKIVWKVRKRRNSYFFGVKQIEVVATELAIKIIGFYYKTVNLTKWRKLFENDDQFLQILAEAQASYYQNGYGSFLKKWAKCMAGVFFLPWKDECSLKIHVTPLDMKFSIRGMKMFEEPLAEGCVEAME